MAPVLVILTTRSPF